MKRQIKDGWHKICGWDVYIEDEKILRGIREDRNGSPVTAFPYRRTKDGSWTSQSGIGYWAFISGMRRQTVRMF